MSNIIQKARATARAALRCRSGAAMVEYALPAALIAVVAVATLKTVGTNVSAKFNTIATTL